jgi:hypothetical protein
MAVRNDFTAGEVLAAADLNDTFGAKLPYSFGTATPTTTDSGFLWYDSNSTPAAPKFWDGAAFQALTSGKILQVVRATDGTDRTTSSASLVDVTGMSVTITPQKNNSAILLIASFLGRRDGDSGNAIYTLTDSSNNAISGGEQQVLGTVGGTSTALRSPVTIIAYATPATTSPVTYKLRFRAADSASFAVLQNSNSTGQLYAIEVSA